MKTKKMNRRQQGFSLIETMVAVLVLSGGLLGLAFLQAQGMKFNTEAYERSQATVLAYDIIDRLRANPAAARADGYSVPDSSSASTASNATYKACNTPDGSVPCDSGELAAFDLGQWYQAQKKALILDTSMLATISRSPVAGNPSLDRHVVTMRWLEQAKGEKGKDEDPILKSQQWEVQLYVPPP